MKSGSLYFVENTEELMELGKDSMYILKNFFELEKITFPCYIGFDEEIKNKQYHTYLYEKE